MNETTQSQPNETSSPIKPVFFDPRQKRWPKLRLGFVFTGLIFSFLLGALIFSILGKSSLPSLNLPPAGFLPRNAHALPPVPSLEFKKPTHGQDRALRSEKKKLDSEKKKSLGLVPQASAGLAAKALATPLSIGFFVNWDDASISSLKENLSKLDIVISEWLHLDSEDGSLKIDDPERQRQIVDYIRSHKPDIPIVPLINNWNSKEWEGAKLGKMLRNAKARQRAIEQIDDYVEKNHFQGISLDFENISPKDQQYFQQFVQEIHAVFQPKGLQISINVPADDPAFKYSLLANYASFLIIMAYDEHWSTGSPGPISSLPWFTQIVAKRSKDVPADKLVFALGNYGYDWKSGSHAEERTFEEAVIVAKESEGNILLDKNSLNPTFDYADDDDKTHFVWILDGVSLFNQMSILSTIPHHGIALWRLGSEDPSVWKIFGSHEPFDAATAAKLEEIEFGYGLDYEGRGEILDITARPQAGKRKIIFDEQKKLITAEEFINFPSPYIISRYGSQDHKIALTFDDGPDTIYTPKILDELKKANVPGTFFIIGLNGEMNPGILQRIANEGHEIGNHTFTHPNISTISGRQFKFELSATQHLLSSTIGRQSLLFRPPYAIDAEPETIDQIRPVELADQLGYLIVGMQLDPDDWEKPGVDAIVNRTIAQAEHGDGNVVLLHDAGGDRSQTVLAIPRIVTELRKRGYQFVKISELLGRTTDQVMPLVGKENTLETWINGAAFSMFSWIATCIHWLFLLGILLGISRLLFIGSLAIFQRFRKKNLPPENQVLPSIAVIVPAYNEGKVILQTISSLLACEYPDPFSILIIDDGSTDGTYQLVSDKFGKNPRVTIFSKPNGGKPSALNYGLAQTSADIVVTLDADTIFSKDAIFHLVKHFIKPEVGAVAGNAKVGNRINLLTRWQALEYITSQNLDRRAFDVLNCITVVPGAIGAWRRHLILDAGGFTSATLAEDADLTLAIRKLGYSILYEDKAIALTEVPDTVNGFIRQRFRWMYGTMQAAWKHRDALFRSRYGAMGTVALPNVLIFQVLFPLISPVMDILLIGSLVLAAFSFLQHPAQYSPEPLWRVVYYYALFVLVDYLAAILAFILERGENWSLLLWLFWQRFFYRQLMYYVAIKSTLSTLRGKQVGWGKLERKATVQA